MFQDSSLRSDARLAGNSGNLAVDTPPPGHCLLEMTQVTASQYATIEVRFHMSATAGTKFSREVGSVREP
jgi:hypothetical protein